MQHSVLLKPLMYPVLTTAYNATFCTSRHCVINGSIQWQCLHDDLLQINQSDLCNLSMKNITSLQLIFLQLLRHLTCSPSYTLKICKFLTPYQWNIEKLSELVYYWQSTKNGTFTSQWVSMLTARAENWSHYEPHWNLFKNNGLQLPHTVHTYNSRYYDITTNST